ncbi:MAG: ATP-binding protein [Methylobacter sp.]
MNNPDPDPDDAFNSAIPGQATISVWDNEKLRELFEQNIIRRESAVIDDEAAVLIREKLVSAREKAAYLRGTAADLRENAVHLRENDATSRELERHTAATVQAESDDHIIILQQANAHLVIAILEAQELAEQVQLAKTQLQSAKIVAEKANLAKSDFLSSMSHELRTPLNAILGFAQLLEFGTPPPTAAQMIRLHQITKAGWYLLDLINEILDLAVIESGKLSLSQEPVSLIEVMRECEVMIESQAQQHGIRLNFIAFDSSWFASADRTRVKQVLINLLSNAIKYNRELGTVEVKCIAITSGRIRISIKDSGKGLSPEKLLQLFQPFNRLGQETGVEEGTGIGLVVTKQLVELMGGTIGVESTVGVGSEFWIELIRDDTPQIVTEQSTTETKMHVQKNVSLRTLLYVEDNPANLMLVEQIIDEHSHLQMLSARDGNHGVALARVHLPEIILMDINLPGISGIQALKILRKDPTTAHIPIIALSANAMPRDIEKGLAAGFFRYLTKPIKINEFMNALADALKFSETESIHTVKLDKCND